MAETDSTPTKNETIVSLHAGYESSVGYVNAYVARPVEGKDRPGVVLLSGMNGLSWTQREITRIYARAGFVAISPDFMEGLLPNGRAQALHAKNSLDVGRAVQQIVGGADFLRSLPWVGPDANVGVMGFCLGGGLALLAAAKSDKFQAGIIYHQSLFPDPRELETIACKLQCHYGTEDESSPRSEVDAFTETLDRYGIAHELHWYEGMGHSFAQITPDAQVPPAQRAATEQSQNRCFEFLHAELGRPSQPTNRRRAREAPPVAPDLAAAIVAPAAEASS